MAYNQVECVTQLQLAIDILETSQDWENRAMLKAQTLGIQGEKRREAHDEGDELCLMQKLQCMANDRFAVELYPAKTSVTFPPMASITDYFTLYHAKLWEMIDKLHGIANELVILKYRVFAKPIYEYIDYLDCELVAIRRLSKEYALANGEFHHISRYEVSYENVHDKYEAKMKN